MEHPFALKKELSTQDSQQVNGGAIPIRPAISELPGTSEPGHLIKPPVATTMAIGEEGGYFLS